MASEKPAQILRSRTSLDAKQIEEISDVDAWRIIYELPKKTKVEAITICFTGFNGIEREALEGLAKESGLETRTSVNRTLDYLCVGPTAGPSKMEKAQEFGIRIITVDQFSAIAENGELPQDQQ